MSLSVLTSFAGSIILGIVTVLFFQCMGALFDPVNRTRGRGIQWGLVIHTTIMFAFVTISTGMGLNLQSISHVDNREFPGDGPLPPGPLGYKQLIYSNAVSVVPNLAFTLNQWLADGLLVSMHYTQFPKCLTWVIALALSLLHYLCRKSLGYCLSLLNISHLFGYALEFSATLW